MTTARARALVVLSSVLVTASHPFAVPGFDALADAPNGLLAWIALAPWWIAVRSATPGEAFRLTWLFATLYFLGTLFWLVIALHQFGGLSRATSVSMLLLLCPFLALFHAPAAWIARRSELGGGLPAAAVVPFAWAAAELLRAHLFTGFPWANLAYTQGRFLAVIQIADLAGPYGAAALIVLANVALAEVIATSFRSPAIRTTPARISRRPVVLTASAAAALLATLLYGAFRLSPAHPPAPTSAPDPPTLRVALVQGNITQDRKHDRASDDEILRIYRAGLREAEAAGAELVVWPEAAIPGGIHLRSALLGERTLPTPNRAWLLAGTATWWDEGDLRYAHNSALLVAPGNRIAARYHKSHLVPFGEYVPLPRLLFFARKLTRGSGSFLPGADFGPLTLRQADGRPVRFGVLICYEDLFPEISRAMAAGGADLLVNITNDAWYGTSSAPYQHLVPAVFRAVETRRSVVRAAQTGITAVILPSGRVAERTGIFEGPRTLVRDVPIGGGRTPYVLLGDWFAFFCLGLAVSSARPVGPITRML